LLVFNDVIVTAPTADQAIVYKTLCNSILIKDPANFSELSFHCVSDPFFARVGSGGGTINAIDYLVQLKGIHYVMNSKILIIHSGGDSRRSPLHSVCGKAWATVNVESANNLVVTPIYLLILELSRLFSNLKFGSCVVASGDVILDLVPNVGPSKIFVIFKSKQPFTGYFTAN
jgi:fucokinase